MQRASSSPDTTPTLRERVEQGAREPVADGPLPADRPIKEIACGKLGLDPRLFIDGAFSDRTWTELANG